MGYSNNNYFSGQSDHQRIAIMFIINVKAQYIPVKNLIREIIEEVMFQILTLSNYGEGVAEL
jgi:hypothetical protein